MTTDHVHFVLDSFALIALFKDEPAAEAVSSLLTRAREGEVALSMSAANLGEAFYLTAWDSSAEQAGDILSKIDQLSISFLDVDRTLALNAASLKARYRMSYADCIAAALAQQLDAAVVTGDPEFRQVEHLIRIEWLPQ